MTLDWRPETMKTEWFRDHFVHAADRVGAWLGRCLPLHDSTILDIGCGDGILDLGLAIRYRPSSLVGVDVRQLTQALRDVAWREIGLTALPANLEFHVIRSGQSLAHFAPRDAVISWSAFEHIDRALLAPILSDCRDVLRRGGALFIQVEPLFFSPYGSHLGRFGQQPWAHLLMDEERLEQQVMSFAGTMPAAEMDLDYFACGFEQYKRFIFDEYRKLNRLTAAELVELVRAAGFEVVRECRNRVRLEPDGQLLREHSRADLLTNEILLLARRP